MKPEQLIENKTCSVCNKINRSIDECINETRRVMEKTNGK